VKLQFLGAATTVTGSQFLLTTDRAKVLVDCGMFQGSPNEAARNRVPLDYDPSTIDAILLTHAHLDHCGMLPVVAREGYRGPIHATRATVELASLVLLDSGKVQEEHAKDRRKRAERMARRAQRDAAGAGTALVAGSGSVESGLSTPAPGAAGSDEEEAAAASAATPPPVGPDGSATERRGRGRPWPPDDPQVPGFDPEEALRRQPPRLETELFEPLYTVDDAAEANALFHGVDYDQPFTVAPGITATFRDAGHILGSAIIEVEVAQGDGTSRRIVFSGDIGRPDTPILRNPTEMNDGADYVLMESTYGGREHEPEDEAIRLLAEAVQAVSDKVGVLLIPSFAIGRTQQIVWELDRLLSAGKIPHVPLYLDSPMAAQASDIYRRYPGYYDQQTHDLLQHGGTPLDYPGQMITNEPAQSRAIRTAPRPMMIVSASGMLTGGRVVHHLRDLIDDPAALLLFVGYQGEGTLGAHLQAGAKQVVLDGATRTVRCEVRSISGFSAHADDSELIDWLRHLAAAPRKPRRVFLVHGDPAGEEALVPEVKALGLEPYRPAWREEVELD
jgi:Cft2 family RNA processing exonuclease